jgi:hypothetical protein
MRNASTGVSLGEALQDFGLVSALIVGGFSVGLDCVLCHGLQVSVPALA